MMMIISHMQRIIRYHCPARGCRELFLAIRSCAPDLYILLLRASSRSRILINRLNDRPSIHFHPPSTDSAIDSLSQSLPQCANDRIRKPSRTLVHHKSNNPLSPNLPTVSSLDD